jgi:hypothetical protein
MPPHLFTVLLLGTFYLFTIALNCLQTACILSEAERNELSLVGLTPPIHQRSFFNNMRFRAVVLLFFLGQSANNHSGLWPSSRGEITSLLSAFLLFSFPPFFYICLSGSVQNPPRWQCSLCILRSPMRPWSSGPGSCRHAVSDVYQSPSRM